MWINNITEPNTIIGLNDSKVIAQNTRKWDFCPTDKRLESQIISVDLNTEKKKIQASIYAFCELWLSELMCFSLKHKLGTVPWVK